MSQIDLYLPTLHEGVNGKGSQVAAYTTATRFTALICGRRWGKTDLDVTIAGSDAANGLNVGWFTPDYKIQQEAYAQLADILNPIKKTSSKVDGVFRTITGGRIDFWTLENERAGRSRKYHTVIIDEAAFTKPNMMKIWQTSILPTLLDYEGRAFVSSTPNGIDPDNFFYNICTDPQYGFSKYHAPTHTNPYLPAGELARLEATNHPLVFKQEYLAEFVDWSGVQFFSLDNLLVHGLPIPVPDKVDAVFAVIDTAVKTGKENDGTAVSYWAISKHYGHPLVLLDWDIVQIEGSLLETWLPTVFQNLEALSELTHARYGSIGAHIEDKASGTILIQQSNRRGWPAMAIDSKLTAMGKDERAISVSGYVYQGLVKISQPAFDKVKTYKGTSRNHFLAQVLGYKIGVKDQADDMLDTFCYAIAIALGNAEGF